VHHEWRNSSTACCTIGVSATGSDAQLANLDAATLDDGADRYLQELKVLTPASARIVDKLPGSFNGSVAKSGIDGVQAA
jgi:hypothetical protein